MSKNFRIYRANKGTGFASEWQLSYKDDDKNKFNPYMLFLTMAKELAEPNKNGDAAFDWQNGIKVKLGENDIGEMLAFLDGQQQALGYNGKGLYHETPNGGNKIISMNRAQDGRIYLKVSGQDKDKKSLGQFNHSISIGEAQLLKVLLQEVVKKIYGW